jgi:acetoin utilization protein AcuB
MLISHLHTDDVEMVYTNQSPIQALAWSAKHSEKRVPIIDRINHRLLGTIHEDYLLRHVADETLPMQYLESSLMAYSDQHIYDIWYKMIQSQQQVIPVVDRNGFFLTCVHIDHLRDAVTQSLGMHAEGLTLLVETDESHVELQHIIGILEREGVRVVSTALEYPDSEREDDSLKLTIRIEPTNADRGISSLRRVGYAVHTDSRSHDDAEWADRADALIRYLDL